MKNDIIIAETHTSEYQIHKYWARKPHNVVNHYIQKYFKKGETLCDPFFGSGIFLVEAKKLGIDCVGFDINPTAFEIANFTLFPPKLNSFESEFNKIGAVLSLEFGSNYTYKKHQIKYFVHVLKYKCPECGTEQIVPDKSDKNCINCNKRSFYNLENCKSTKIVELILENGDNIIADEEIELLNNFISKKEYSIFQDKPLVNRRILSFPNLEFGDFFTQRAKNFVGRVKELLSDVQDKEIRTSLEFFFASCLIQFTKLIPYRNNLDTGGPAWSIPGFWVAHKHLEANPLIVIRGRFKKFTKAIAKLEKDYNGTKTKTLISNCSYHVGFKKLEPNSIDGIFFDPPYGGDVPYLEFSFLWNSFYQKKVAYESEIVVSDRKEFQSDWAKYYIDIFNALKIFREYLKPSGKIILTFNNLNPKAWVAILESFINNSFKIVEASYQIPAVVSSKAQKAKNTSYVGDYYLVFEKTETPVELSKDDKLFYKLMEPCLYSRSGTLAKNLLVRHVILNVIRHNLSLDYITNMENYFKEILDIDGDYYKMKEVKINYSLFEKYSIEKAIDQIISSDLFARQILKKTALIKILSKTEHLGMPSFEEINLSLTNKFELKGDKLIAKEPQLF